jgi:hypothetical protein
MLYMVDGLVKHVSDAWAIIVSFHYYLARITDVCIQLEAA